MDKITFNIPSEQKRKLEQIVAMLNVTSQKRITITDLILETLDQEFNLTNEKTSL